MSVSAGYAGPPKGTTVPRPSPGKIVGLFLGGLVVVVMLVMMFVILGNLFMGQQ